MSLQGKSRTELIDQALDGQSAEVKARVLAIIIRYNIDVRNEFFLIFVAIGHLLAIVEESPENWRSLFDDFKGELDEWTSANLRTLEAIHQQGAAQERMSQSFLKLTDSILNSNGKTETLHSDLIKLSRTLDSLTSSLKQVQQDSQSSKVAIVGLNKKFEVTEDIQKSVSSIGEWISVSSFALVATGLLLTGGLSWGFWQQQQTLNEHSERLQWIQQKAEREECLNGIVSPDESYCQQYFD